MVNFADYGLTPVADQDVDYKSFGLTPVGQNKPQEGPEKVQAALDNSLFSFLSKMPKDIAAGLLHSVTELGRALPNVGFYDKGEQRPIDKFDAYKFMQTENKPAYTAGGAAQVLGELIPGGGEALVGLGRLGAKGIGKGINFVKGAFKDLEPYEQAAAKAAEQAQAAQQGQKQAVEEIRAQTGKGSEGALKFAKSQAENELAQTSIQQPSNLPILSSERSAQHLANAEMKQAAAAQNVAGIESGISRYLNKGADHDVHAASQILKAADKTREGIGAEYDALTNNFKQRNVVIDNSKEIKSLTERLTELLREGKLETPAVKKLGTELATLKQSRTVIPADEYLTVVRSAKDYARQARSNAFKPGMNAEERAEWHRRYEALDHSVEEMEGQLEKSVGKADSERLKKANTDWRENVIPLQKNPTFQTIRYKGRIEGDIMNKLRGTDKGDVIMRDIIKKDPEILKNVVGKRYAEKPTELHEAGERENEYIDKMPELKNMLRQHKEAEAAHETAGGHLETVKQYHENVLKQEKQGQALAQKEQEKFAKSTARRQELQDEIKDIDHSIAKIKARTKQTNLSLEEKMKAESELSKLKRKKEKNRNLLFGGLIGAATVGIPGYLKRAGKVVLSDDQDEGD